MGKFFNGLLLGLLLGVAAYWFVEKKARQNPEAEKRYEESAARARESSSDTAHQLSAAFKAKLETLKLNSDSVKDELARSGKIVRSKTPDIGEQVQDAATDARIVAAIKAKYVADSDISAWQISVESDQGHVTLSGTVSSPEYIGKAVAVALDTDGVRGVTYNLEVKK
jgi:hyperosmotically inducible protein